mgnify:CR=1 FL=1
MKTTIQHKLAAAIIAMLPAPYRHKNISKLISEPTSSVGIFGEDRTWEISVFSPPLPSSYKGIWLSGWGTVGFDKDDTKEFDLTVGYSIKGFSASITDYWFDGGAGYFHYGARNTSHVFEAQIGYDFDFIAVNWYTNFAGNDGLNKKGERAYSSYFSLAAPFKLGGLDWCAEVGATPWATSFYNKSGSDDFGANGFEIANISLAATKTLDITESYSLPVSAKAIWNPATEGAYFVFGINF